MKTEEEKYEWELKPRPHPAIASALYQTELPMLISPQTLPCDRLSY